MTTKDGTNMGWLLLSHRVSKVQNPCQERVAEKTHVTVMFFPPYLGVFLSQPAQMNANDFFADQSLNRMPYNFCINFDLSNKGTLSITITSHRTTKGSLSSMPPWASPVSWPDFLEVSKNRLTQEMLQIFAPHWACAWPLVLPLLALVRPRKHVGTGRGACYELTGVVPRFLWQGANGQIQSSSHLAGNGPCWDISYFS